MFSVLSGYEYVIDTGEYSKLGYEFNRRDEMVSLVNREGKTVGSETRWKVHTLGLLHGEAILCIKYRNKLLFQEREDSKKFCLPGGHLKENEGYVDAAYREVIEEETNGLPVGKNGLKEIGTIHIDNSYRIKNNGKVYPFWNKAILKVFKTIIPSEITAFDKAESNSFKYFGKKRLEEMIYQNPDKLELSLKEVVEGIGIDALFA